MDLIDRSEVQYKMLEILPEADSLKWYEKAKPDKVKKLVDELYSIVLNANKIDAQPVKHGRWVQPRENGDDYCSVCGSRYEGVFQTMFCPCCGAKMYGEEMDVDEDEQTQ